MINGREAEEGKLLVGEKEIQTKGREHEYCDEIVHREWLSNEARHCNLIQSNEEYSYEKSSNAELNEADKWPTDLSQSNALESHFFVLRSRQNLHQT